MENVSLETSLEGKEPKSNSLYILASSHALRACDDAFFFFNLKKNCVFINQP